MSLELIPAIDILGGKVVRLREGDYDAVTVYAEDPAAMARELEAAGATRLHLVDLDGAREGKPVNDAILARIAAETGLRLQVGGGIRSAERARLLWGRGVERVVLGTLAVKAPEVVRALAEENPAGVVVAIDARDGEVAVEGWLEGSGRETADLAREVDGYGVAGILYTRIERDGTGEGPDVGATVALQREVEATVIASGGIGHLDHVRALRDAGVRAAVCGRALFSGAFTLAEAFAAAAGDR
ncbi:MAG: 1-(5-phosphoribosyl)-5-[(5-phosphoribosylamino)methylideneamino]imidazole-4-carboxamide isomerase [Sandaracinus sp.]|nr:1-(5-phosphoribosyl)-5-[(5-phosphoribosylamino)methylideneamino]imidazole-4-carboxamide isomerase [Sandaracinus sp.]